jgi:hypothetical protein
MGITKYQQQPVMAEVKMMFSDVELQYNAARANSGAMVHHLVNVVNELLLLSY